MKSRTLILKTFSGTHYRIHENGDIQRTDIPDHKPTGQWKAVRLVKVNGSKVFSLSEVFEKAETDGFVEFHSEAKQNGEFILRHKNRNPKLFLVDNDHGAMRQWSDGIVSITLVRESSMRNQVFLDPSVPDEECWRVCFGGIIVKADFNCIGAAKAYLNLLEKGYFKKEPSVEAK